MVEVSISKKLHAVGGVINLEVAFEIQKGDFIAIAGPSGAGKTTLLRCIAGLSKPDKGLISIHNTTWFNSKEKSDLKVVNRKIGFVFQDYALFPNMSVKENLEYALEKGQDKSFVSELLNAFEIDEFKDRDPNSLSGGQKQRVAIARAIVRKPDILLLDEPLSALDPLMRHRMQEFILTIHRRYHLTTLMVSHDVSEIFKLSDRVIVLEDGKITKQGKPSDVFISSQVSGKFKITGEIVGIEKQDVVYIISVLVGSDIIRVIGGEESLALKTGSKVMVVSKAFNPVIIKI
jgi:molybdate transport system ATP-binding protein